MTQRIEETHGPFRIIAGVVNKTPQAIAYMGTRPVFRSEGDSPEQALETLKELVVTERAQRAAARIDGVPLAEEYEEALSGLFSSFDPNLVSQLAHHLKVPEAAVSMMALGRLTRQTAEDVQRGYASLGRSLRRLLEFQPYADIERELRPITVFALPEADRDAAHRKWSLRSQAAQGFAEALAARSAR